MILDIKGQVDLFEMLEIIEEEEKEKQALSNNFEQTIKQKFDELYRKSFGNNENQLYFSLNEDELQSKAIQALIDKKMIQKKVRNLYIINPEHYPRIDLHDIDQYVNEFKEHLNSLYENENHNWFHALSASDYEPKVYHAKDIHLKPVLLERLQEEKLKVLEKVGLDRYDKMSKDRQKRYSTKDFVYKEVFPIIHENIHRFESYKEIKDYFHQNYFYAGKASHAPYPKYIKLLPTDYDVVCLLQAKNDEKMVYRILNNSGILTGGYQTNNHRELNAIYPKGYSYDNYIDSLSEEDWNLIEKDIKRLSSLHNREIKSHLLEVERPKRFNEQGKLIV